MKSPSDQDVGQICRPAPNADEVTAANPQGNGAVARGRRLYRRRVKLPGEMSSAGYVVALCDCAHSPTYRNTSTAEKLF